MDKAVHILIPEEPMTLTCEDCLSGIPESVAHSLEGPDYILHFCGLHCYDNWCKVNEPEHSGKAP
jgi:hypothetical protein